MKPYWQSSDGLITIYHGDMLEVLPRLQVSRDNVFSGGEGS